MDLADALEPAQQLGRVGIDPDDLGGLVGDGDLDQLVELLIDAALQQRDQVLPGDVGPATAPELFDLRQLIQSVLKLLLYLLQTIEFSRLGLEFVGPDNGELLARVRDRAVARSDWMTLCR